MSFDACKTLLLEKQYLYVRASKGFQLEGISTEKIWTNTGYYRFLTSNVADTLGNSYVTIHYDSSDLDFNCECSDLFLEEIQNSVTVAVENIQTVLEDFAETNHEDIDTLSDNLGTALGLISDNFILRFMQKTVPTHIKNVNGNGSDYNIDSLCPNVGDEGLFFFTTTNTNPFVGYFQLTTSSSDKYYFVTDGKNYGIVNTGLGGIRAINGAFVYIKRIA